MGMLPNVCPKCGTQSVKYSGPHIRTHESEDYYILSSDGPVVLTKNSLESGDLELICYDCDYRVFPFEVPMGIDWES